MRHSSDVFLLLHELFLNRLECHVLLTTDQELAEPKATMMALVARHGGGIVAQVMIRC